MTTKSNTAKTNPFDALPEQVRTALALVPTPQNKREAEGRHLNPRMGRLLRAFRAANGNIAQTKVAGNPSTGAAFVSDGTTPLFTTHCQIATLEQGGCKKGADESTIKLLSVALAVSEDVIRSLNEADLKERADSGDKRAQKVLGIEEELDAPADSPEVQAAASEAGVDAPAKVTLAKGKKAASKRVEEIVEAATPAPVEL